MRAVLPALAAVLIATPAGGLPGQPDTARPTVAQPSITFEQRLQALDDAASKVKGLRARFVQRKFTPMLKKPLVSSGTLAVKDARSRWDTERPRPSVMTIDDTSLCIFYPDQKVQEVFALTQDVRGFSGSPLPRVQTLRQHFDIAQSPLPDDTKPADQPRLLSLSLAPKAESLKAHVLRVAVIVDTSVPCATKVTMEMPDGDRTEIDFDHVVLVEQLDDKEVTFTPPAGTRVEHPLGDEPPQRGAGPGR
ncbi:hypothetical protein PHYC_02278 [Phycisphaerales bacterium]|nr:hypothetical protein PHYC_02278 [Phycisphaerales bacterium]